MATYFTLPTSVTAPADGNKVALTAACEWHRDDSGVPDNIALSPGAYRVFEANEIGTGTVTAPSGLNVTPLGPFVSEASGTTVPITITGLDAFSAGDQLVMVFGPSTLATAAEFSGGRTVAVDPTNNGGSTGGRITVLTYTLVGDEAASEVLTVTQSASFGNAHVVSCFVCDGGGLQALATGNFDQAGDGQTLSASVQPTQATNIAIGVTMGRTPGFGTDMAWVNLTQQRYNDNIVPNRNSGESYALGTNLATGSPTVVTANNTDGSDDRGIVVLVFE